MTELTVAFRDFTNAHQNAKLSLSKWRSHTGGSRRTAPHILNVGTGWVVVVTFPLRPFYLGYQLNRKLGGIHTWCWRPTEQKTLLYQPGIETRIVQPLNWSTPTIHLAKLTVIEGRAKAPVVTSFWPLRTEFSSRPVYDGFVVNKVALRQVIL